MLQRLKERRKLGAYSLPDKNSNESIDVFELLDGNYLVTMWNMGKYANVPIYRTIVDINGTIVPNPEIPKYLKVDLIKTDQNTVNRSLYQLNSAIDNQTGWFR